MQKEKGVSIIIGVMIIVVAAVLIFGGVFAYQYFAIQKENNQQQNPTACTEEAKVCPDGSSVGRTGPNCEFTECPDQTAGWKTYKNEEYGFEFKYPKNMSVVYTDTSPNGWGTLGYVYIKIDQAEIPCMIAIKEKKGEDIDYIMRFERGSSLPNVNDSYTELGTISMGGIEAQKFLINISYGDKLNSKVRTETLTYISSGQNMYIFSRVNKETDFNSGQIVKQYDNKYFDNIFSTFKFTK